MSIKNNDFMLYLYDISSESLHELNSEFLNDIKIVAIKNLNIKVLETIKKFEMDDPHDINKENACKEIIKLDDIFFKIINIYKWRCGFGYACIQLSMKDEGSTRIVIYASNKVHHSGTSFGTTPHKIECKFMLEDIQKNQLLIKQCIEQLKMEYSSNKIIDDLVI
jgi:hypothetical protein